MEIKLTNAGVALQQNRDTTGARRNVLQEQRDMVEKSRRWTASGQGKNIARGFRSLDNDGSGGKNAREIFDRKV